MDLLAPICLELLIGSRIAIEQPEARFALTVTMWAKAQDMSP
jgi:hypothetical protein